MNIGLSLSPENFNLVDSLNISAAQIFTADPYKFQRDLNPELKESLKFLLSKEIKLVSHGSLITNMVSEKRNTRVFSANSMFVEILRCHDLGISTAVFHPGSSNSGDSIQLLAESLNYVLNKVDSIGKSIENICLENMVDSGNHILCSPEQYKELFQYISDPRIKICLDTCHCWGAGYTPEEFIKKLEEYNIADRLKVIHFNDSQVSYGSHKERHASLSHGTMSKNNIYWVVDYLKSNPYIIAIEEQPKEDPLDIVAIELHEIINKNLVKIEETKSMISISGKSLVAINIPNLQEYLNIIVTEDKLQSLTIKFDTRPNVKSSFGKLIGDQLTIYTGAILSEGSNLFSSETEKLNDTSSILLFIVFLFLKKAIAKEDLDFKATSSFLSYIRMDSDFENTYNAIDKFISGFVTKYPEGLNQVDVSSSISSKVKEKKENPNKYKPLIEVPEAEIPEDLDLLSV